jgi:hypothetical protein
MRKFLFFCFKELGVAKFVTSNDSNQSMKNQKQIQETQTGRYIILLCRRLLQVVINVVKTIQLSIA